MEKISNGSGDMEQRTNGGEDMEKRTNGSGDMEQRTNGGGDMEKRTNESEDMEKISNGSGSLQQEKISLASEEIALPQTGRVRMLTESALLVALATVLSLYAVFKMPNSGSATIGSMIPIILVSIKYPFPWAVTMALVYSAIQMLTGFGAPPVKNLGYYTLMILLDYVLAFGVLCLSGPIYRTLNKMFPGRSVISSATQKSAAPQNQTTHMRLKLMTATLICITLRFICHFLSGMLIWNTYAPPNQPVWLYSLVYNGAYMLAEALISGAIMFIIGSKLVSLYLGASTKNP